MIIDGKKIALKIYDDLKIKISKLPKKPKFKAILVGDNKSSLSYIKQKQKWSEYVGIDFELIKLDSNILEEELISVIKDLNYDSEVNGYIVQLPLPKNFSTEKIINLIDPKKDVDGFCDINIGKILNGSDSGLIPCTPAGIMKIIEEENIDLLGKNIVVIGRSNIVGKPVSALLINKGATVTVCNSKTKNLQYFTKNADIIIVACGSPEMLKLDMINDSSIIIDVGFTVVNDKIFGDCDFLEINKNGNKITPVPGGVGPMTVAMLLNNVYETSLI